MDQAISLSEEDEFEQVEYLLAKGNYLRENLQEYSRSIGYYKRALTIFREIEDNEGIMRASIDLANSLIDIGQIDEAVSTLLSLGGILEEMTPLTQIRYKLILAKAYHRGGYYSRISTVLTDSEKNLSQLAKMDRKIIEIDLLNIQGLLAGKLGQAEEVQKIFDQAVNLSIENKLSRKLALSYSNFGFSQRNLGNLDESIRFFSKALEIDKKEKDEYGIAYSLRNLGISFLQTKNLEEAKVNFNRSLKMSQQLGLNYNLSYCLLGLVRSTESKNNYDDALLHFNQALDLASKSGFQDFIWRSLGAIAEVYHNQGNSNKADLFYQKAIRQIDYLRSSLQNNDFKQDFRVRSRCRMFMKNYIRLLLDRNRIDEAWRISEKSRSRSFMDSLAGINIKNAPITFVEIQDLQSRLAKETKNRVREELMLKIDSLRQQLRKDHPDLFQILVPSSTSLDKVQSKLNESTVIVQYMITDDEIIAWLISRNSVDLYRNTIDRESLSEKIELFRLALQSYRSVNILGDEISKDIFDGFWQKIDSYKTIGIVPHGPLHFFPLVP